MSADKATEAIRDWWQELGFYYDIESTSKRWRVMGDDAGIQKFIRCLREYAAEPRNNTIGEHEHYGPYYYLEIGTSAKCEITDHWIAGPLLSILSWADQIDNLISLASIGDTISVGKLFAPDSQYDFVLEIRASGFDPATADPQLS